jgi:hypothetical protein
MSILHISFEGFFLCRLATDPDPSAEQRGVSGFTYSIAGESLLEPSIWSQARDVKALYGMKDKEFIDPLCSNPEMFNIKNIREASPDYSVYNTNGIGIKVTAVDIDGEPAGDLGQKLMGGLCRFKNNPAANGPWKGPIFEGRNQITSDGDPDRFTINPLVFSVSTSEDHEVLCRYDPMDFNKPEAQLYEIFPNDPVIRRLPVQRFALSTTGLQQVGIDPDDLPAHFANRALWLESKVMEAEAMGNVAMAEAYKSRLYAVNFFTQATGPTVLANRLLSRIPLRQLYSHTIRGTEAMVPNPVVDENFFGKLVPDITKDWPILYYLGQYDGDLMSGYCSGTLSVPLVSA